jgi:protein-S-isoprenylcysteine O-methyltransferase Ste14
LKDVVAGASTEIDHKLDKISVELHNQRQFTKDDVKELVDYAAERLSYVLDDRIIVMKREISALVEEKTEYLKTQVDDFFIQRQRDLALERRRLWMNIVLAFIASLAVGGVSLFYRGIGKGPVDMLTVFRIVLASLAGGYVVYLGSTMLNRWMALSEHRKDALYVAARYWGWLRPGSVFATLLVLLALLLFSIFMLFPEQAVSLLHLHDWMSRFKLGP